MSYNDRSSSELTRRRAQKAVAAFYAGSTAKPSGLDSETSITLRQGRQTAIRDGVEDPGCCGGVCPTQITWSLEVARPFPYPYDTNTPNDVGYRITWYPPGNTYIVDVSANDISGYTFDQTDTSGGNLYVKYLIVPPTASFTTYVILRPTGCAPLIIDVDPNPCFLAGSLVTLANGTTKPIEDIRVGDIIVGAFGEHNEVLALHRPVLGSARMSRINGEHSTTSHHPHISTDRQFYCAHPAIVEATTYGHEHEVIDATGATVKRMLHGLRKGRVQELTTGVELKTIEGGRVVSSLELYDLPPETQLYNLVVGGSHTYHVDGYAVTGWPREDDFDYDAWVPRSP